MNHSEPNALKQHFSKQRIHARRPRRTRRTINRENPNVPTSHDALLTFAAGALLIAPAAPCEPPTLRRKTPKPRAVPGVGQRTSPASRRSSPTARARTPATPSNVRPDDRRRYGQVEIMDELIKAGAEVNGQSPYGTDVFAAESGGAPP